MGLEAVEAILAAIKGAKDRRASSEEATMRFQMAKDELAESKRVHDQQNVIAQAGVAHQQAMLKLSQEAAKAAQTKQRYEDLLKTQETGVMAPGFTQLDDPNKPTGMDSTLVPRKLPQAPRMGEGSQIPVPKIEGTPGQLNIPDENKFLESIKGMGQGVAPAPPDVYKQTPIYPDTYRVKDDTGAITTLKTQKALAKEKGEQKALEEGPKLQLEADIKETAALHEQAVKNADGRELARLSNQLADQLARKAAADELVKTKLEIASRERIAAANNRNAIEVANIKELSGGLADFNPQSYADNLANGTWTLDDAKKFLKPPQLKQVVDFMKTRDQIPLSSGKSISGLSDIATLDDLAKSYGIIEPELSKWDWNLFAKGANAFLSTRTKGIITAMQGAAPLVSKILQRQDRTSDADARSVEKNFIPTDTFLVGGTEALSVILDKHQRVLEERQKAFDRYLPGMSESQRQLIMDNYKLKNTSEFGKILDGVGQGAYDELKKNINDAKAVKATAPPAQVPQQAPPQPQVAPPPVAPIKPAAAPVQALPQAPVIPSNAPAIPMPPAATNNVPVRGGPIRRITR